jgi:hypothetical protein
MLRRIVRHLSGLVAIFIALGGLSKDFKSGPIPAGPRGLTGPARSALGYAHIFSSGQLDTSRSKGVLGVTNPGNSAQEVVLQPLCPAGFRDAGAVGLTEGGGFYISFN